MALNVDNSAIKNTATEQPRQQAEQPKVNSNNQKWSFHSGSLFAAPISRGVGSEYYIKLKTALIDFYKNANPSLEITLIDIDNSNDTAMVFSSLVVAVKNKDIAPNSVAYHILLLEATGEKLKSVYDNIGGVQTELIHVTSDALDDALVSLAARKVKQAFPNDLNIMVDGCVVPSSFNPEDRYSVHKLALNAGLACSTEIQVRVPGFKDFNLASVLNESTMAIDVAFNRQQMLNVVGDPMRSDVLINFNSTKTSDKRQANRFNVVNTGDRQVTVAEATGFIDLVWAPVNQSTVFNPYQPVNPALATQTQSFAARFVLTNLASDFSYTPSVIWLALSTALSLRDDNNWIQGFRPMPNNGNVADLTDIGAINIAGNLERNPSGFGERINTKSDDFKDVDLGQFIAASVRQGLMISLDCPEVGPQSWYTSVFAAAANGSTAAYDVLYDAANDLTNGAFGRHFQRGTPMFVDLNNRVHLGTWIDNTGAKRDIRDIDMVAVCNLAGDRNPQLIAQWSNTFLANTNPLLRFDERRKLISAFTNETAVFTGCAQRVTFNAQVLEALGRGFRESGLPVRVNTPMSAADFNNRQGVATFANEALLQPGQSFAAASNFGYTGAVNLQGTSGYQRW